MTTNSKYILTAGSGNTLLDLRLNAGVLSLAGQVATVVGSAAADYVYASLGTSVDFSQPGAGADILYLDGQLSDYSVDTSVPGKVTLSRTSGVVTSTYTLSTGDADGASFAFTDGSISAASITSSTVVGDLNPAVTSLTAPDAADGAAAQRVSLQNAGVVTATSLMGKLTISGSSGIDQVYVKAGAKVDATLLGGSTDVIWMTGKWSDYTKTVSGSTVKFERTMNGSTESVTVVGGSGALNDKLMFADGYIFSKDALAHPAVATLGEAGGVASTKAGEFTDVSVLGAVLSGVLTIDNDTGTSATDYIVNTSAHTISGSYTGVLEEGDAIELSIDGGATWHAATLNASAKTFSYASTLVEGVNAVQVRVLGANGSTLAADRSHVITLTQGASITLDTHAPTGTMTLVDSGDAFINQAESVAATPTNIQIKVQLGADVQAGDVIQLKLDGVDVAGATYTVTKADLAANGGSGSIAVNLPKASVVAAGDGAHSVTASFVDIAGNSTTLAALTVTLDTNGPIASYVISALDVDGTTPLSASAPNQTDAYLNASETNIVLEFNLEADPSHLMEAGDHIQLVDATGHVVQFIDPSNPAALLSSYTVTAADLTAGGGSGVVRLSFPKTAIAGSAVVDGTYNLAVRAFDDAGNTHDSATTAIVVDSVAVSANISVSSVADDGVTARTDGTGGTDNQINKFISSSENEVVLKIDSTAFGATSGLKAGDVITLEVRDAAASNLAGHDVFVTLKHGDGTDYTVTMSADDAGTGDGLTNAAYLTVAKSDLESGAMSTIRAKLVDLAGNESLTTNNIGITVQGDVTLHLATGLTDLEVNGQIVLTSSSNLATAGHKLITFTNTANDASKAGFDGESTDHTFTVYADDARYVTISGDKVIIKPPFDFDFSNNYQITVEAGAFLTAADAANDVPAQGTKVVVAGDNFNFSTVTVGDNMGAAVQGQLMSATDGSVTTTGAKKWFAVDRATSDISVDLAGDDYAMVFKDQNAEGQQPDVNDGVGANDFTIDVANFGAGDLIYADDQANDSAKLNDKSSTQVIDLGAAGQQMLHFDPASTAWDGGTFNLTSDNGSLSTTDVLNRLNVANTAPTTSAVATAITGIDRVDSTGAVVSTNLVGASVTDAQPLRIKVSAADMKSGDVLQLVYVDANGVYQNLGSAYTAIATDVSNGYVLLSLSHTQLAQLPVQEGFNKVFAKLTNSSAAVSYSSLLGGDNGLHLDFVAPTPTISFASGEDATLSSAETSVNLVVAASHLSVGDVLVLKLGTTQLSTHTVVDADLSTGVTFNVTKAQLAVGANTLSVTSTDEAGNVGTQAVTVTRSEYVTYSGQVGLGPVVSGNDLQVTAYDAAGNVLATSTISASGQYSLDIDKSYVGAVTLRVANKTALTTTNDYFDEATGAAVDIGTGTIAAVIYANGVNKTVNISTLTDLVARTLVAANVVTATSAQIDAYNKKLAELFVDNTSGSAITEIAPTFVVDSTGTATLSVAGKYGQLLSQISAQAVANSSSLDGIQRQLADAIQWTWDSGAGTATATLSGDIAKQVVLLTKVAQAAALVTGADASQYLTAADLTSYGLTAVSGLSADRQSDIIARIVESSDNGHDFDTLAEIQSLVTKVVALAKIQDYANDSTNNAAPTLADYSAAGITGLTANNLTAVNFKMANSAAAGTTPNDALIQAVATLGVAAQTSALQKIVDYADNELTNPAPTLTNYQMAGIHDVTTDNLEAVNTALQAATKATLFADTPQGIDGPMVMSQVQTTVDAGISNYTAAMDLIRAYVRDGLANPAPTTSTYADAGLSAIDTADERDSANYYLNNVLADADATKTDASVRSLLKLQNTAILKIQAYAADNSHAAPTVSDYTDAGITGANTSNLSQLNAAVDAQSTITGASALATLLSPVFDGVPGLSSIVRAGTSNADATLQVDSYLNADELAAGQTAQFTVTFDRSITGITASNFDLTDAAGNALTGATPTMTVVNADSGVGKVWLVTVSTLTGLSSASLRLNLANNTDITDVISGHTLSTTSYTSGQSYTVDSANTVTLTAATGEDLTLDSAESSVNLYVAPTALSVGDNLYLTKADGSQLGAAITVTQAHLSSGVTFNVSKSSLTNGANALTVHATDVAGNQATSSVTVNVSEYVQVSGFIGFSSKVLSGNDLVVTAYDANNNVLGTGTINAATSTYTLQLLKTQAGLVNLKVSSGGTGADYWDEATAAQLDLGNNAIAASINADGTAKTANITLLSDLASRIIGGISSPSAAQISAVNTAITKLLVSGTSTTEITAYSPDFAVSTTGTSTPTAATIFGQLMSQLSEQAKETGSTLAVVLNNMANGISWDGTIATLNSAFAKHVFLLAKAQLAASLNDGANASAYLTAQDFTDYGVTGVSTLSATRQLDLIARIVSTSNDGNQVDTLAELQALADKVVALGKIQDYADLGVTAPTVSDYAAAGITGVNATNLTAVNLRLLNSDTAGTSTDALVQSVVTTGVNAQTDAVAKISAYAAAPTTAPTVADYVDAGITGVSTVNLASVNAKIDASTAVNADTVVEIQSLVNSGIAAYGDAIAQIKAYILDGTTDAPTAAIYADAGLSTIDTADEVANANFYLNNVLTNADASLAGTTILSRLTAQQTAVEKINSYAVSNSNPLPNAADYIAAGISGATSTNVNELNAKVDIESGITTVTGLQTVLDSVFAAVPTVISITTADSSVVNGAYQSDAIINSAELSGSVSFTVTFDRAVSGVSGSNFALVNTSGVAVTGATPSYSVTTTDNKVFTVTVSNLTGLTSSTARLDLVNNTGIHDSVSNNAPATTTFTSGQSYTVDTTVNTTVVAASGEDLTLNAGESAAHIFVAANKLQVGDQLVITLKGTTTQLATATVTSADITAGGVTLTVLKSNLTSPTAGATTDASNQITLTHNDVAGNVSAVDSAIVVARAVTVQGTIGLGPVVSGSDLLVTAYDAQGNALSTATVDSATGQYTLTINQGYTGAMLLKLSSTGAGVDYRDEATNTSIDLGSHTISAVIVADGTSKTANITTLTDIAARLLTVSGGMIASDVTTAKVTAANTLVAKQFISSTSTSDITAITPDFTIDTTGTLNTTASRYGQVLAQLSKQIQSSGTDLAYAQATIANSISFSYNAATPASSTMSLGQAAKDTVFLAKVAQAAQLSSTTNVSSVLTVQDLIDYGVPGFSAWSATRQQDVINRIVNSSDDANSLSTVAQVNGLVTKVKAIGVIQDYKAGTGTAPSVADYVDAGITGVTTSNLAATNTAVKASTGDITTDPDTVIATAASSGVTAQSTALTKIVDYATNGTTAPTVDDYTNAGITGVTATNLVAINSRVDAAAAADVNTLTLAQAVVNTGIVANSAAISAIKDYLADSVNNAAPTLATYKDANLVSTITTAEQLSNANYLLSKVLAGQTLTNTAIGTALGDQVTAFAKIDDYAAVGGSANAPTASDYNKAGFSIVTASNLADINARIDALTSAKLTGNVLAVLQALDLDNAIAGTQTSLSSKITASNVGSQIAVFDTVNKVYVDGIASINIAITGTTDPVNDQITFGSVTRKLVATAATGSDITINTVSGVDWSYSSSKKLVFTKTDGSSFTAAEAQLIEQSLKFSTPSNSASGVRTFTLTHTDASGNVSSSVSNSFNADTYISPVDLDTNTIGTQNALLEYLNATTASSGNAIAPSMAAVTDTDIAKLTVVVGGTGFDASKDQLVLDATQALNVDFTASNITLNGVSGINYTYTASTRSLVFTMNDGSAFDGSKIPTLVAGILFKTSSTTQGGRTFTISYEDGVGNTSSAVSTVTLDTLLTAPVVSLSVDDGVSSTDKITTDATINITGIEAGATWAYSLDGTTWSAGTGTSIDASVFAASGGGAKTVQVRVTDVAGNQNTVSFNFTLVGNLANTATINGATDNNPGSNASVGSVASPVGIDNGTSTDDTTPTLFGQISMPLAAGQSVVVYDGSTKLGNAAFAGGDPFNWTYTPFAALAKGAHSFSVRVEDTTTGAVGQSSDAHVVDIFSGLGMTITDTVGTTQGAITSGSTDDNKLTFSGSLPVALGTDEELAVYQTIGGVTTKMGVATLNGLNWSYQPTTALADGSYTFKAMVQPTGNTAGTAGKVVSATSSAIVIDAAVPTQTATITGITDNLNTNGSVGNTTTAVAVASGTSTDDTTPTLAGTISAALTGSQVLAIYDGATKLGNATVSGTAWSYTPTVGAGAHSFTARVESTSNGNVGTSSAAYTTNVNSALSMSVVDDVGVVTGTLNQYRYIRVSQTMDLTELDWSEIQVQAWVNGVLTNVALNKPVTSSNGNSVNPNVVTNGSTSDFYENSNRGGAWLQVDLGQNYEVVSVTMVPRSGFNSRVQGNIVSLSTSDMSAVSTKALYGVAGATNYTVTPGATTLTFTESTDDSTPTITGTLPVNLMSNEELAVYGTINGVTTKLGVATVGANLVWSFTPSVGLADGAYTFKAMIQAVGDTSGTAGRVVSVSSSVILIDTTTPAQTATITGFSDNVSINGSVGNATTAVNVSSGQSSDDIVPVLSGTISSALTGAQQVVIYDGTTRVGTANVAGTNWTFTPFNVDTGIGIGEHRYTVRVENIASGQIGVISSEYRVNVFNSLAMSITDDVGASKGALSSVLNFTDDNKPTFSGTLDASLTAAEELAVYALQNGVYVKLGAATVAADRTWTYTPTTAMVDGSYTFQAMVQPTGDTTGKLGTVVSNVSGIVVIDTATPTQTTTITGVTDNVSTNGSTAAGVTTGTSTDDTTPTLAGTISGALTGSQVVAVYDGATKLGNAAVSGTAWTFTPTVAAGAHSFTARVENAASGAQATASSAYTVNVSAGLSMTMADDVGTTKGTFTSGATDDSTPTFSGKLDVALGTGEELAVYKTINGITTKMGAATVAADRTWTYTPAALTDGSYTFKAMVQPTGDTTGTAGKVVSATSAAVVIDTAAPTQTTTITGVTDNVTTNGSVGGAAVSVSNGTSTDDTTPTLTGTISSLLSGSQVVAIYDGATKLGNATIGGVGTTWSFTPNALTAGVHSLTAVVENSGSGVKATASSAYVVNIHSGLTVTMTDDAGAVKGAFTSGATDDNTPTFSGTLDVALGTGEELAVYKTINGITTKMGVATVAADRTWTYTPAALTDGSYTFKAMVQPTGDTTGTAGEVVSATSSAITIANSVVTPAPTQTTTIADVLDNVATNGSTATSVTSGWTTDDTTPTLTGTISAPLVGLQVVAIYDGATRLGEAAVVSGATSWQFTPTALLAGNHSFTARVENPVTGEQAAVSSAYSVGVSDLVMSMNDDVGALQGALASGATTDDKTLTLSGKLAVTLGTGEELAIYQIVNGMTSKLVAPTVGTDGSWSYTTTSLADGTYTFKAMIQPTGNTVGDLGRVVSTTSNVTVGSTDKTFDAITNTDPTSGLAVKALAIAANMTLDLQTYSHAEIDALNLGASSIAKIDLADVMQNGTNLFTSTAFANLTGTSNLHQMVINGSATSSVQLATDTAGGTTWTKSTTAVTNNGHTYDVYNNSNGQAQLLIDQLVQRSGAVI